MGKLAIALTNSVCRFVRALSNNDLNCVRTVLIATRCSLAPDDRVTEVLASSVVLYPPFSPLRSRILILGTKKRCISCLRLPRLSELLGRLVSRSSISRAESPSAFFDCSFVR